MNTHTYKAFIQWPAVRTNLSEIKTEVQPPPPSEANNVLSM